MSKRLMGTFLVIEPEPFSQAIAKLKTGVKAPEIQELIFDRPPESLDKNVVLDPPSTVHTNANLVLF